jgi:hypothetical protein
MSATATYRFLPPLSATYPLTASEPQSEHFVLGFRNFSCGDPYPTDDTSAFS